MRRLVYLYVVVPLLLFVLFCSFLIWFTGREMNRELWLIMNSELEQKVTNVEETVDKLCMVAEQMAYGYVSTNLSNMLLEKNPYEKSRLIQDVKDEINVISFTNVDLRLLGYYSNEDKKFVFMSNGFSAVSELPDDNEIFRRHEFIFHGPHTSYARNYNDLVLSVTKKVPFSEKIDAYAEMVISLDVTNPLLKDARVMILDPDGRMVYSNADEKENLWKNVQNINDDVSQGYVANCYYSKALGKDGYQIFLFVPGIEYYQLYWKMLPTTVVIVLGMGMVSLIAVIFLVRNLTRPVHIFEEEIKKVQEGDFEIREYKKSGIPEYDHLLDEIMVMKHRIMDLVEERENTQRQQTKMKVEQLMYKINPHFLMNSLDTIHWLAKTGDTEEIDRVAVALNKLLYYNLKVDKNVVCMEEELLALGEYVHLMQSRFDFTYEENVTDKRALKAKIPRFILQPLAENAIYHGLKEDGVLRIIVSIEEVEKLCIRVCDNGEGMEPKVLKKIHLEAKSGRMEGKSLGIGLNYVVQILKEWYGDQVSIQIQSGRQEGTKIQITLPYQE